MNKQKKFKRVAGGAMLLALASICVVGTTFARYTSSVSGNTGTGVALWSIKGITHDVALENTFNLSTSKLSPCKEVYDTVANKDRTNDIIIGTYIILNESDVAADITISTGKTVMYSEYTNASTNTVIENASVVNPFVVTYEKSTNGTDWSALTDTINLAARGGTAYIKATITWNSDKAYTDTTSSNYVENYTGVEGDANDTVIGMFVKHVDADITFTAVQASQRP